MIDLIAFLVFILLFFILIIRNIQLSIKYARSSKELLQSTIDKNILAEKLFEASARNLLKNDSDSEAFLKFISDSRDWAYQYIEDVQKSLNSFITNIEPEILYFDTYGDLMAAEPNYQAMKKISDSFKDLKKMLPVDYGKIDT
jgi:predicted PurR-regulated permease PerM